MPLFGQYIESRISPSDVHNTRSVSIMCWPDWHSAARPPFCGCQPAFRRSSFPSTLGDQPRCTPPAWIAHARELLELRNKPRSGSWQDSTTWVHSKPSSPSRLDLDSSTPAKPEKRVEDAQGAPHRGDPGRGEADVIVGRSQHHPSSEVRYAQFTPAHHSRTRPRPHTTYRFVNPSRLSYLRDLHSLLGATPQHSLPY